MRATIALLAASASAAWCPFAMSNPAPIVNPSKNITVPDGPARVPVVDIGAPAGPLTHVYIGDELGCQVAHILDGTVFEFYPSGIFPGDCGTFIATGGRLYAPDLSAHGGTAAAALLGPRVVFTRISQVRTGTGTAVDPFRAVTLVGLPPSALRIQQTDTYIAGDDFYRTDVMIINNGGPATGVLYRAGDAKLARSDLGFGFTTLFGNRRSVGCSVNANNMPAGRIEEWIPLTGPSNYYEESYDLVWARIATQTAFPNQCACIDYRDNGAGISWNFSIPALGSATFSHLTAFPASRRPLVTSKTALNPTSVARSRNDYTIKIDNPNTMSVTLSSITDTLPAGFSYISNLTSGVTTSNPTVSGQRLTWNGPFVVLPGGSISLSFAVIVASMAGVYYNEAGGQAGGGFSVASTGPTAPITVTPCPGTIFSESFDNVTAPALPANWNATPIAPGWMTSTTNSDTPLNAAFVAAPATIRDALLVSPEIPITSSTAQVSFRSNFDLQSGFDGGVLEVSSPNILGGAFTDILAPEVRGTFVTGGYNAEIDPSTDSPIAGRMAWSGSSCGYVCTVANLGPNVNGQTIRLRFRMGSDNSMASPGWRVDTIQVLSSGVVCGPCLPATLSPAQLLNISARALVGIGPKVLIVGFIVTGNAPKTVAIRGIGPSLAAFGIPNPLADPTLNLRDSGGNPLLSNDNWRDDPAQAAQLMAVGLAPTHELESAMIVTLPPCASYTAILAGRNGGTGVGVVDVYDLDPAAGSELANISARGFVDPGAGASGVIGGFILGGSSNPTRVAVRGMGPSLPLSPVVADPTLALQGATPPILNNNWMLNVSADVEFPLRGLVPLPLESGIFTPTPLAPGAFTAILEEKNGSLGFGLVEIYNVH